MTLNLPPLAAGIIVGVYWGRVLQLIRKMRRRVGNFANVIPAEKTGRIIRIIWIPLTILWIALPIAAGISVQLPWIFLPLIKNPWIGWISALVALIAFLLTLVCWQKMGKSWRLGIDPEEKTNLIVTGMYAHIRHPIYALSSLLMLATAAADPSPAMLFIAWIHLSFLRFEARREEWHLARVHGQAYLDYCGKTGRFLPKF